MLLKWKTGGTWWTKGGSPRHDRRSRAWDLETQWTFAQGIQTGLARILEDNLENNFLFFCCLLRNTEHLLVKFIFWKLWAGWSTVHEEEACAGADGRVEGQECRQRRDCGCELNRRTPWMRKGKGWLNWYGKNKLPKCNSLMVCTHDTLRKNRLPTD